MKTLPEAIKKANLISKGNYPETSFVIFSADKDDMPGNNFHACFKYDLDTFYKGCEILYCSDEQF